MGKVKDPKVKKDHVNKAGHSMNPGMYRLKNEIC